MQKSKRSNGDTGKRCDPVDRMLLTYLMQPMFEKRKDLVTRRKEKCIPTSSYLKCSKGVDIAPTVEENLPGERNTEVLPKALPEVEAMENYGKAVNFFSQVGQ